MKSELAEKLMNICAAGAPLGDDSSLNNTFGIDNLTEEQRLQVEAELINHFDFSKIVWMKLPSGFTEDGDPIVAQTIKIYDTSNTKYTGQVGYVYKIFFTPKMYDPMELYNPVKDGCVFAPTIYDPETFTPTKSITLTWSPEFPQDINATPKTYEEEKQMIRNMLEKVLADPKEYMPVGYRACGVRFAIGNKPLNV